MKKIKFPRVTLYAERRGICVDCGKRHTRNQAFWQEIKLENINPATGMPKTREEIVVELRIQIERWRNEPVRCGKLD
jgi:hypothetical protein